MIGEIPWEDAVRNVFLFLLALSNVVFADDSVRRVFKDTGQSALEGPIRLRALKDLKPSDIQAEAGLTCALGLTIVGNNKIIIRRGEVLEITAVDLALGGLAEPFSSIRLVVDPKSEVSSLSLSLPGDHRGLRLRELASALGGGFELVPALP